MHGWLLEHAGQHAAAGNRQALAIWAEVKTAGRKLEKNRLLASAILGSSVPARPAKLSPPAAALSEARRILQAHESKKGILGGVRRLQAGA